MDGGDTLRRLNSAREREKKINSQLKIRIFGPYAGDCEEILKRVAERLRSEENYDAEVCSDLDMPPYIEDYRGSSGETNPVYNLEASLEAIRQADAAVFIFMEADDLRFRVYGPFPEDNESDYYPYQGPPSDLNSSVIVEFTEWIRKTRGGVGDGGYDGTLVTYEGDARNQLGSLVRGIIAQGEYTPVDIDEGTREKTVTEIYESICGAARGWKDDMNSVLVDRTL